MRACSLQLLSPFLFRRASFFGARIDQAKHHGPTAAERESYKAVLKKILEDSRVTPEEVRSMLDARER